MDFYTLNVDKILTSCERTIMKTLVQRKSEVISIEELADALWKNDTEKFSLYSITKHIQNIRQKISAQDINQKVIKTINNQGYIISN